MSSGAGCGLSGGGSAPAVLPDPTAALQHSQAPLPPLTDIQGAAKGSETTHGSKINQRNQEVNGSAFRFLEMHEERQQLELSRGRAEL